MFNYLVALSPRAWGHVKSLEVKSEIFRHSASQLPSYDLKVFAEWVTSPGCNQALSDVQFSVQVKEVSVKTMTYTQTRENFASTLDAVLADREEVVVTRAGKDPVVIVSLEDYESLKETAYLLRNPANARRLFTSIERLEAGQGVAQDLAE